jgi:hypothetical protein
MPAAICRRGSGLKGAVALGLSLLSSGHHCAKPRQYGEKRAFFPSSTQCALALATIRIRGAAPGSSYSTAHRETASQHAGFFAHSVTFFMPDSGLVNTSAAPSHAASRSLIRVSGTDWAVQTEARSSDRPDFVRSGALRADLFFRLAAVTLTLPPLRLRQDFDWLLDRMLRQFCHLRPETMRLSPSARAELKSRDWPGNLRELASTIEVAIALAEGSVIDLPDLPPAPLSVEAEAVSLADVLAACGGNMALAARRMGVNRSTILRRARREGLLPQ